MTVTSLFGKRRFDMSATTVRPVADVSQDLILLGPIADVAAECEFDDEIVRSDVYWAELVGFLAVEPVIVDGAVVDLDFSARAPVASRLR